jgi:hypothetical protein
VSKHPAALVAQVLQTPFKIIGLNIIKILIKFIIFTPYKKNPDEQVNAPN